MLGIVCHDAGGAELVSSYLKKTNLDYIHTLGGPAQDIFKRKLQIQESVPLDELLTEVDFLMCGTSWQSNLEYEAIALANEKMIKSVAFIDHWTNYRERFVRNGKMVLPSEIWVGDEWAKGKADAEFPHSIVRRVENPYFEDIRSEFIKLRSHQTREHATIGDTVLFLGEPISEHALKSYDDSMYWGYTEYDALAYLLTNTNYISDRISEVVIRPHPAEDPAKYEQQISSCTTLNCRIENSRQKSLVQMILEHDIVAGCDSMGLFLATLANKRVVSCIPVGGAPCMLPPSGIEHLQDLIRP